MRREQSNMSLLGPQDGAPQKHEFTAFVNIVCKCGWVVVITQNETAYCDNPNCPKKGVAYKILVKILELAPQSRRKM